MKKIALIAMAALISAAASAQNALSLKGTVPTSENDKTAYLYDYNAQKRIDSAKIVNGKFEFNTKVDKPTICRLGIDGADMFDDLIVENYPMEIVLTKYGFSSLNATQGLNVAYQPVVNQATALSQRIESMIDSLQKVYPGNQDAMGEAFTEEAMPLVESFYNEMFELAKKNTDNELGVYLIWKLSEQRAENLAKLDELIALVPMAKDFTPVKNARAQFIKESTTGPGQMFLDFNAKSVDGKDVKLSDYVGKGKYVLVDFWASWCGPCMQEVPNLKYLHETYPDLVVLGVNVWDKHDSFLEALKKKGMTWTSIYASDNKDATELYGIKGIPTIILFGPDGKIVDRTLRGEKMKEFIGNLFKK